MQVINIDKTVEHIQNDWRRCSSEMIGTRKYFVKFLGKTTSGQQYV